MFLVVKLPINHDIELLRGFFQQLVSWAKCHKNSKMTDHIYCNSNLIIESEAVSIWWWPLKITSAM